MITDKSLENMIKDVLCGNCEGFVWKCHKDCEACNLCGGLKDYFKPAIYADTAAISSSE